MIKTAENIVFFLTVFDKLLRVESVNVAVEFAQSENLGCGALMLVPIVTPMSA